MLVVLSPHPRKQSPGLSRPSNISSNCVVMHAKNSRKLMCLLLTSSFGIRNCQALPELQEKPPSP